MIYSQQNKAQHNLGSDSIYWYGGIFILNQPPDWFVHHMNLLRNYNLFTAKENTAQTYPYFMGLYMKGLAQDCGDSIAEVLELLLSCAKSSWCH